MVVGEAIAACSWVGTECQASGVDNCVPGGGCSACRSYGAGDCGGTDYCVGDHCVGGGVCVGDIYCCTGGDTPPGCGGCFTAGTEVDTPEGTKEIQDLEVGETVESFYPETGEATTSLVEKIYEVTRSAYFQVFLEDGSELQVTAEHPLYAIQERESETPASFWEYLKTESLVSRLAKKIL